MFSYSSITPFTSKETGISPNTLFSFYAIIFCLKIKLNAALTGIKFSNYDWDVISRDGRCKDQMHKIFLKKFNTCRYSCM